MSSPQGPIRVLHVDDDASFAEIAAQFLERTDERFEVDTETSAADGIAALAEGAYDCVVSDYQMPGRDGLEFLTEVRVTTPTSHLSCSPARGARRSPAKPSPRG